VSEVGVIGNIERLSLKLCVNTLSNALILRYSSGPGKEARAIQCVPAGGTDARAGETGRIGVCSRECEAGRINVVDVMRLCAAPRVDNTVREVKGLRTEQAKRISADGRCERNSGAARENVVEAPSTQDGGIDATNLYVGKWSDGIG